MVKSLEITGLHVWMPMFGCRFKDYDHRILGFLASDTPDVVLVGKANMLPDQLSKVLYINCLTTCHSWVDRFFFFFFIVVYCVFVPTVKERFRGNIDLPEIYKVMLCSTRAELLITYTARASCLYLFPSRQQPSPSTSKNAHSMSTLETG